MADDTTRTATPFTPNQSIRSAAIIALVVAVIVGTVGLARWDLRLMTVGLFAGVAIGLVGIAVAMLGRYHAANTAPGATYLSAEDVIRLRSPKGN